MATVAVSTEPSVISTSQSEPGRLRVGFAETFGYLGTWLRLLWRHWPVLLAFTLGGTIVRQLVVDRAVQAWDGLGGLLIYPLIPISMLVPLVLMLRVLRPSLPYLGGRSRPEKLLVYFANVLLPFLVFYIAARYADLDYFRYAYRVAADYAFGDGAQQFATPVQILVVAAVAFILRFVLTRTGAVRKIRWIILPAVYLEVLWLFTALFTLNTYRGDGLEWLADTRIGQATLDVWHRQVDESTPLGAAITIGRSAVAGFLNSLDLVLLAPVSALVAGSVVLAARARRRPVEPEVSPSGLKRVFRVGVEAGRPVGGRLALLSDGLRRVFQAGVVSTMVFCLGFVTLGAVSGWLFEPIRLLIGSRDVGRVWAPLYFPLQWLTDAVELVLIIAFIAAFVDRTAARIARMSGPPTSAQSAPSALPVPSGSTSAGLVMPEQSTARPGTPATVFGQPNPFGPAATPTYPGSATPYPGSASPAYPGSPYSGPGSPVPMASAPYAGPVAGGALPGTPSFGGISPVTPVYTTSSVPPPTFGGAFAVPTPGLVPPPSGPSATPPAGLVGGLWEDGQPDVPRKPISPGDDDRRGPGIGG